MDDEPVQVERTIEVEAAPEEVWELLVDDEERATWFGGPTTLEPEPGASGTFTEPDGTRRHARIDLVVPCRRLGWTWWPEGGAGAAGGSRVDVVLRPVPGGTQVTVVERPLLRSIQASAGTTAGATPFPLFELELAVLLRAAPLLVLA